MIRPSLGYSAFLIHWRIRFMRLKGISIHPAPGLKKHQPPPGKPMLQTVLEKGPGRFSLMPEMMLGGDWVLLLGAEDTPARADQVYFDPHEIVIESTENTGAYFLQFARGESGAVGLAAGTYTECVFESDAVGQKASGITRIQTGRAPAGAKIRARCMCPGQNTGTIDFYIGIHEYQG